MKTKLMLAIAFTLIGSVAFAQESASSKFVAINQGNPAVYKLAYSNPGATRVRINIVNSDGAKVYSEALSVDGFVRKVNFKGMDAGDYTIEVSDNTGSYSQKVSYSLSSKSASIHVAKIAKEESKYLLSVTNEEAEEINVRILDGDNNIVHTQSLAVNGSVGVVYDLAAVQGTPTFEVTDSNGASRTIKY